MNLLPVTSRTRRRTDGRSSLVASVLTALLLAVSVSASTSAEAGETRPAVVDPGPVGDFAWKGFNWEKRWWTGAPNYNKQFDAANVSNPDANGHVTMTLSNPTGGSAIGAEFNTTRHGFGYGTYSTTIEKDLSTLQKEVVWGCLFTYDPAAAPGFNEIDLCEASSWGGGSSFGQVWPITQGHGYWFDASKGPGVGNDTAIFAVTDHPVLTHRMVWEPDRITFETFAGEGYTGQLLKRTVLAGEKVPEPARETVHFNLWVTDGGGGDPARVVPEKVVVRDFSFVPRAAPPVVTPPVVAPAPTPAPATITLAASSTKTRGTITTTLSWSGAAGSSVTLLTNGVRSTVPNTGGTSTTAKSASVRYQVCDAVRCSPVVVGGR
ncbi:hypothetical protein [Arthrobacter ruber]|uniref:hypothetical protein n=1 Tax=Arthrobacter ruber TaxID=1258893 RepID=UPI001F0C73B3|nr:hypothetical protein [Arthrobacter ruber]